MPNVELRKKDGDADDEKELKRDLDVLSFANVGTKARTQEEKSKILVEFPPNKTKAKTTSGDFLDMPLVPVEVTISKQTLL